MGESALKKIGHFLLLARLEYIFSLILIFRPTDLLRYKGIRPMLINDGPYVEYRQGA